VNDAPQQPATVPELIARLSSAKVMDRERARVALVALGRTAAPELVAALQDSNERVRLEACKALTEIGDPSSIPALIHALESDHQDIRWVASEALVNLGGEVVEPLLKALIDRAGAHTILAGAHHILHAFARRVPEPIFEPVLAAIEGPQPGVGVPPAAEHLLTMWHQLSSDGKSGRHWPLLRTPRPRAADPYRMPPL
jgi:hypothetical protein